MLLHAGGGHGACTPALTYVRMGGCGGCGNANGIAARGGEACTAVLA